MAALTTVVTATTYTRNKRVVYGHSTFGSGTSGTIDTGLTTVEAFQAIPYASGNAVTFGLDSDETTAWPYKAATGLVGVGASGACVLYWTAIGV